MNPALNGLFSFFLVSFLVYTTKTVRSLQVITLFAENLHDGFKSPKSQHDTHEAIISRFNGDFLRITALTTQSTTTTPQKQGGATVERKCHGVALGRMDFSYFRFDSVLPWPFSGQIPSTAL